MRRRSRASGEPTKVHHQKTAARKSGIAPKAVRPRSPSAAREETKVARLARELKEALQRQTGTSEILTGYFEFARKIAARVRCHTGKCNAHLRGPVPRAVSP